MDGNGEGGVGEEPPSCTLRLVPLLLTWPLVCAGLVTSGGGGGPLLSPGSPRHVQLGISHPVFLVESSRLQAGLTYQVVVRSIPRVREVRLLTGGESIFTGPGPPVNFTLLPSSPQVGNITFRILYRLEGDPTELEVRINYLIAQDCELTVGLREGGELSSWELPYPTGAAPVNSAAPAPAQNCLIRLQSGSEKTGFILNLEKLNVPCSQGSLRLLPDVKLCGKLEELPDRQFYFPSGAPEIRLSGRPVFRFTYLRVDPCYNLTLQGRNGSLELLPRPALHCFYNILLPYGYRVDYTIQIGERDSEEFYEPLEPETVSRSPCSGLSLEGRDPQAWSHCATEGGGLRELHRVSTGNSLRLEVKAGPQLPEYLSLRIRYEATGQREVSGACGWPGIAYDGRCVWLSAERESWPGAEAACSAYGGHLVSVLSHQEQNLLDLLLINSPDYREDEAVWIGGSDMALEGDFRWTDSRPFAYTNWFAGWKDGSNRQPNDDGLSGQDCLEMRRLFGKSLSDLFKWNDRDCSARNKYICEALPNGERMPTLKELLAEDCNKTVTLTLEEPRAVVTSPGFPDLYPDDSTCLVTVTVPPQFPVLVDFEELVLESEPSCSYDFVEVSGSNGSQRYCGDLSDRLKLLRQVLAGPKVRIKFVSDYSHNFLGFKALVSLGHSWPECGSDKLWPRFNDSCYLVVSYPEVSWNTARKICNDIKGELASLHSSSEERFIITKIRESLGYSMSAVYWLGGSRRPQSSHPLLAAPQNNGSFPETLGVWEWTDGSRLDYTGTRGMEGDSSRGRTDGEVEEATAEGDEEIDSVECLALRYAKSPTPQLPSGLYWTSVPCDMVGGYVCKKKNPALSHSRNTNRSVSGPEGRLTSPGYPASYPPDREEVTELLGPPGHRLVLSFQRLELEPQTDCLYDWLELDSPPVRLCGHHTLQQLQRLQLVTDTNRALVKFHSDYSVTGGGWALDWRAVDVSGCPLQTTTAKQGFLLSPNYPHFLLSRLDCATTVLAPEGKRVLVELEDWDVPAGGLSVELGGGAGRLVPFAERDLLSDGAYVSRGERLQLTLTTGDSPTGRGFKALYKTVGEQVIESRAILVSENGRLLHLNYPLEPPALADYTLRLIAPLGFLIQLHFHQETDLECSGSGEGNLLEVSDPYGETWSVCGPLTLTSYLNTLRLRQIYGPSVSGLRLNATLTLLQDAGYRRKLYDTEQPVESCLPNPCQNGGLCVTSQRGQHSCQCTPHFAGLLCGLTVCETEPCQFGNCSLTSGGYSCHCFPGYSGRHCDLPLRPCSSNPCDSRGECVQTNRTAFKCKCHAWWEGERCERRMMHIPYKPLSARMLQEPFWLGLITVTGVLGVIGLFWCAKRHFPEKLEKLLAEEDNRRSYSSRWSGREQPAPLGPRSSLLGRLGIRKQSVPTASPAVRTFSLDDLLRPPATPSPRKKRNNSTPVKKSCCSEKKQILQQLVASEPIPSAATVAHLAAVSATLPPLQSSNKSTVAETSFSAAAGGGGEETRGGGSGVLLQNSKLEKKVTFARLLDKVSSEMSSGSELESGGAGGDVQASSPPSSQADSRSSSDTQLNNSHHGSGCVESDGGGCGGGIYCRRGVSQSKKTVSADSILAMFRNMQSLHTSPSSAALESSSPTTTQPTTASEASSPPNSTSSRFTDSPPATNTIQVSVLDPLSAQKSSNSLHPSSFLQPPTILLEVPNKCLSPIREVPTPPFAASPVLSHGFRTDTLGSPPPRRANKSYLKDFDKPNSLDLPCPPPLITITSSMTDTDTDSPAAANTDSGGMCYLSPFSVCSRNDRIPSESNLSSSGYSSMASPGPSRCGSNNPLCPGDRSSPLLRAPQVSRRGRSDSETTSDDPQPESNDEGFGTDALEEKMEELKKLPQTVVTAAVSVEADLDNLLRPPSIVVESAASSRSSSPLSDKTRLSPVFYSSDGLYEAAAGGGAGTDCCRRRKERRKERSKRSKSPLLLEVPLGGGSVKTFTELKPRSTSKLSPKRRNRHSHPLSSTSSSSAESVNSLRDVICEEDLCRIPSKQYFSVPSSPQDLNPKILLNEPENDTVPRRKISKLKTVSHQIRFLRRLEASLERSRSRQSEGRSERSSPERPLLCPGGTPAVGGLTSSESRAAKRSSWLRARGAVSDTSLLLAAGHDWDIATSGHTD